MKPASPVARFFTFRALTGPAYRFGEIRRLPDQARARQAVAARRAFLSDLSPGQRALANLNFGDTQ